MDKDYRCPDCGRKPRFIRLVCEHGLREVWQKLKFHCQQCQKDFDLSDEGFGNLFRRIVKLYELYP